MTGRHIPPTAQTPQATPPAISPAGGEQAQAQPPRVSRDQSALRHLPRTLLATNALLLLLLAFQLSHRPKYEYMTTSPSDYTFNEKMSALGAQGWKTESCRRASDGAEYSPTFKYECIMSRPKMGW